MSAGSVRQSMYREITDKALLEKARQYAYRYVDTLPERSVYPPPQAIDGLSVFDEPLPEDPREGGDVLEMLDTYGGPCTCAQTGGRYFGFVNGAVIPTALAARWLSDVWDQNAALYVISPIAGKLETVCERWLKELLSLPDETVAGYVGGSSVSILCGLAAARYAILKRLEWDVNQKGLLGAPRFRVVASEQAHGAVFKALALLGLGKENIETVPADEQGRIDPARIPALDSRTLLILQAGNVNTGAFDAFGDICDRAARAGAWTHVDGAFGLWAMGSASKRALVEGVERADSWSLDGHKTLNTPYDCGIVLCRHPQALAAAMQAGGSYIQYSDQRDGMRYVPDMSRRARAIELWATLKSLGRAGIEQLVDHLCARAAEFAASLDERGFRILNDVVFNQVLVACDGDGETRRTLRHVQESGECWCGATVWRGRAAIRLSVCSWVTSSEDVQRSVRAFVHARDKARGRTDT